MFSKETRETNEFYTDSTNSFFWKHMQFKKKCFVEKGKFKKEINKSSLEYTGFRVLDISWKQVSTTTSDLRLWTANAGNFHLWSNCTLFICGPACTHSQMDAHQFGLLFYISFVLLLLLVLLLWLLFFSVFFFFFPAPSDCLNS